MPKAPTAYHHPETLTEALTLLKKPNTHPLAGGTKLLAGSVNGEVVDLQKLGLNQVDWPEEGQENAQIGATVRLADLMEALAENGNESDPSRLLQQALRRAGPNTLRNAATIGGAVASRLPDSELLAALLVLEASATLYLPGGSEGRLLSLTDYLQAETKPAGLIAKIQIAWQKGRGALERVARTPADYPIVAVVAWQPEGQAPRLAATGIQQRPCRLTEAEAVLEAGLTPETIEEAGGAAQSASQHPGDFRGSAAYRAEMAAVLTRRLLHSLL